MNVVVAVMFVTHVTRGTSTVALVRRDSTARLHRIRHQYTDVLQCTAAESKVSSLLKASEDIHQGSRKLESSNAHFEFDGFEHSVNFVYLEPFYAKREKLYAPDFFGPGTMESAVANIFGAVLKGPKRRCSGRPLVVDAGMNSGYFTNLAAALGAQVLSFDVQNDCVNIGKELVSRNGFQKDVNIYEVGLASVRQKIELRRITKESQPCEGGMYAAPALSATLHNDSRKLNGWTNSQSGKILEAARLDEILMRSCLQSFNTYVDLMKIDCEGLEPLILSGASDLLENGLIRNIVVEVGLNVHKDQHSVDSTEALKMLSTKLVKEYGFKPYALFRYDQREEGSGAGSITKHPLGIDPRKHWAQLQGFDDIDHYILHDNFAANILYTLDADP